MKENSRESSLPRFAKLDVFNPHRPDFQCKHEDSVNPAITPEAEAIFQQAQALNSYEIWPEKREYARIAALYEQAMKLGHWKAQFNLAGMYLQGSGVPQDIEKAIALTEDLMQKGVPAAWDNMGNYYMGGVGSIKQDATVAYAFWQKAADMGSMAAQTYIGEKLTADHDEPPSFWGNRPVGLKMLQCAFAQGSGKAAAELGLTLDNTSHDYSRALEVLQGGVKLGSEDSARYLALAFENGDPLVRNLKDQARADRYRVLADALFTNPDIRFPNLDKVLPLPPASLPMWDGNKQALVDAAKAVVPKPAASAPRPASAPASERVGRAHVPAGLALPEQPQLKVSAQYETTSAPVRGYWLARLLHATTERHDAWNAAQLPLRYEEGEIFDRSRTGLLPEDGRVLFHYVGEPVAQASDAMPLEEDPRVLRGIARYAQLPAVTVSRAGDTACPQAGVWAASIEAGHPMAALFNGWARQAYVEQGQPFPDLRRGDVGLDAREIQWTWLGNANLHRVDGVTLISLGDLPAAPADGGASVDGSDGSLES